jgi:hypothetical protein
MAEGQQGFHLHASEFELRTFFEVLGLLYLPKELGPKKLGANFEHFGLQIGPELLINARTLTPEYS